MEKSIFDPALPYIGPIPIYGGRFALGKVVRIKGTVPSVAYRFDIYLQCGPETTPRDDVALQVSISILEGFIVLNSLQNGVWDEEQRLLAPPIKHADRFEITILADFSQYKIAINGQHYCEFPQRIRYDRITHLAMDGDVSVIQISYESSAAPLPMPFPRVDNDTYDFEIIDAKKPAPPGLHGAQPAGFVQPPPAGFVQPPPYGMSMPNNQRAPSLFSPPPAIVPYPVGAPYPTGPGVPNVAPYPTGVSGTVGVSPYPPPGTPGIPPPPPGAPYPTGVPGTVGASPYPPPGAPGIPPPPPGAPILHNAASSNFRPVKLDNRERCLYGFGAAITMLFLILCVGEQLLKIFYIFCTAVASFAFPICKANEAMLKMVNKIVILKMDSIK